MQGDPYTRLVLSVIAVCLLVLVAQGFGLGGMRASAAPEAAATGRYTVSLMRTMGGPTMLRTDTVSGSVWRLQLNQPGAWELLGEGDVPEPEPPAQPEPTGSVPQPPQAGE